MWRVERHSGQSKGWWHELSRHNNPNEDDAEDAARARFAIEASQLKCGYVRLRYSSNGTDEETVRIEGVPELREALREMADQELQERNRKHARSDKKTQRTFAYR